MKSGLPLNDYYSQTVSKALAIFVLVVHRSCSFWKSPRNEAFNVLELQLKNDAQADEYWLDIKDGKASTTRLSGRSMPRP